MICLSLVLSSLTTRSFRRRLQSAHFPIFSQKHLASELSVANSRDISVDAFCSPFIHRNVVVRYSPRIRSRNHTRGNIEIVLRFVLFRAVRTLAMLKKEFLVFIFLEIRSSAHNCGRQFSNGITKKKKGHRKERTNPKKSRKPRYPSSFPRSSLCLFIYPNLALLAILLLCPRSSRNIPRPLTIFIPFHTAFLHPSVFFPPCYPTGPVLSSNFTLCQNSFT